MQDNNFPFELIVCTSDRATPNTRQFHWKKNFHFMLEYVISGRGTIEHNGEKYHCSADTVYFFNKGESYKYYHDPEAPWEKIFIIFTGTLADTLVRAYGLENKLIYPNSSMCRRYFEQLLDRRLCTPEISSLAIHNIINILSFDHIKDNTVPEIIRDLQNSLLLSVSSKFSLSHFAEAHQLSEAYLIRQFKKHYNTTPYEYLLQCRLDNACRLLSCSNLSVKEISAKLNFNDQYYFSNLFRQKIGMSPKKFRNENNKSASKS